MAPRQLNQAGTPPAAEPCSTECVQGEQLKRIDAKLDQILERLARGDTNFATLQLRVRALEVIVYGGCGVVLLYLLNKLLAHSTP